MRNHYRLSVCHGPGPLGDQMTTTVTMTVTMLGDQMTTPATMGCCRCKLLVSPGFQPHNEPAAPSASFYRREGLHPWSVNKFLGRLTSQPFGFPTAIKAFPAVSRTASSHRGGGTHRGHWATGAAESFTHTPISYWLLEPWMGRWAGMSLEELEVRSISWPASGSSLLSNFSHRHRQRKGREGGGG